MVEENNNTDDITKKKLGIKRSKCVKCNEKAKELRRGMCLSCYRKTTGLSGGKESRQSLEKQADNIIKLKYEIRGMELQIKKLPELKERLKDMYKEFESSLEEKQ